MDVSTWHVTELVEGAPGLPALQEAITEAEHSVLVAAAEAEAEAAAAAAAAAAAEAAATAAEEARLAALAAQYEAMLPEDIKEAVNFSLEREVGLLRSDMAEQFAASNAALIAKLGSLQPV